MEYFWLLFVIMAMQPVVRQWVLETMRRRAIAQLEQHRGSRVILLVHRQETMRLLGFPLMRYIDIHDSEEVLRAIHQTGDDVPLDIVLHTPGGLVVAALQIARALKHHPAKVSVIVPHYAMSGGTLIAMAADEIIMCKHSILGPIDPQIGHLPAASILRVVEAKPIADVDDETLILADIGRKAMHQVQTAAEDLLKRQVGSAKAEEIAAVMTDGHWTHDYPLTADEAKNLGLKIRFDIPSQVMELMRLYPQMTRTQASVEYLPQPHPHRPGSVIRNANH